MMDIKSPIVKTLFASLFSMVIAFSFSAKATYADIKNDLFLIGVGAAVGAALNNLNNGNNGKKKSTRVLSPQAKANIQRAKQIQNSLNLLGYNAGKVDGRPGRNTRNAISKFQINYGYTATGKLSNDQFRQLLAEAGQSSQSINKQMAMTTSMETQSALNILGYKAGVVDGKPGRKTRNAISKFQRDNGYAETGELNTEQFVYLKSQSGLPSSDQGMAQNTSGIVEKAPALPSDAEFASAFAAE